MATSKEFKDYAVEQLSALGDITCRPMMGEFLLYYRGVLFGGLYDGRVLVKITEGNKRFGLTEEIPYAGAKPMFMLDMDDVPRACEIVEATYADLKDIVKKKRK